LVNGNLILHHELEQELAEFFGKEAALVFSAGYLTNIGVISSLVERNDVVIIDKQDHASILDGCLISHAEIKRFAHNDPEDLEKQLRSCSSRSGRLVVVDGVYSMEGDICALPEMADVCARYEARLMVDDAHSAGVLGDGRGTAAHFGLGDAVDLIMLTFSKSFASLGGAILGTDEVIHYIKHNARSMLFSAAMPPSNAAAALAALRVVRTEPSLCQRVMDNASFVRKELQQLGFDVGHSQTPVVPVKTRDWESTVLAWRQLMDAGVYTNPVIPPAATCRLRTSYMATHTQDQLEFVISAFARIRD
jgi:7-keto-8-aminopelargonate synthetase-like enzyme